MTQRTSDLSADVVANDAPPPVVGDGTVSIATVQPVDFARPVWECDMVIGYMKGEILRQVSGACHNVRDSDCYPNGVSVRL